MHHGTGTGTGTTTTTTRTTKPSFMSRLRNRGSHSQGTRTTRTTRTAHRSTATPVHHHNRRHVSLGDKISGAMLKLKGTLTRRPGVKAAGTRRMHGTDGRGSRRVY